MLKEVKSNVLFVSSVPSVTQNLEGITIKSINPPDWTFLAKLHPTAFILTLFNRLIINNLCPYLLKVSNHGNTSLSVAICNNGSVQIDPFWNDCLFYYSYRKTVRGLTVNIPQVSLENLGIF